VGTAVTFGALIFSLVRVAAGGLTDDADQYGYGDEHDDYQDEQRDYGDGHEIFLPAWVQRPPGLLHRTVIILSYKRALRSYKSHFPGVDARSKPDLVQNSLLTL